MKTMEAENAPTLAPTEPRPLSSRESLERIFEENLKDIYWAERYLVKSLSRIAGGAFDEELKDLLDDHLTETKMHVGRLEKCFDLLELKPVPRRCDAMVGLVKETRKVLTEHVAGHARDAALIADAQKIEHYEISAYGTLRTMANILGRVQCAELFEDSKDEEVAADAKLSVLAEKINKLACAGV